MRRRISLFTGVLLFIGLSTSVYGKTSVLIDFDLLKANGTGLPEQSKGIGEVPFSEHPAELTQHMPTLIDYSGIAGSNFSGDDVKTMNTSLAAGNWNVKLNSSASTVENKGNSFTKEWHTKFVSVLRSEDQTADQQKDPEGYTILGARIRFSDSAFNNWAIIKPPFEIPVYEDMWTDEKGNLKADYASKLAKDDRGGIVYDPSILTKEDRGTKFLNGKGVVRNVGIIKSLDLRVYGCQFKNSISVLLKNENDIVTEYHMPQYLDFDGWRKITWTNPNYIANAANRDLYIVPLYPRSEPFVKIYGFRVYRQGDQLGGDFVSYIKDVVVTYDEAVLEREDLPIIHEDAWGILATRREEAKKREFSKIGNAEILRFLERQKMDK
ncbi:MAG: hypothetical protein A2Y29_06470 [Spirochaetes bacterium GWE2_31_10]|nr:MAG: hypothetical protein A2Y30_01575 [Spirochaetes bacterium GWE1_32_154]OHD47039.1 MAG: hypothetical protein A2Y29_06470 [Spirochaetes bacterium GWE2_31_10]